MVAAPATHRRQKARPPSARRACGRCAGRAGRAGSPAQAPEACAAIGRRAAASRRRPRRPETQTPARSPPSTEDAETWPPCGRPEPPKPPARSPAPFRAGAGTQGAAAGAGPAAGAPAEDARTARPPAARRGNFALAAPEGGRRRRIVLRAYGDAEVRADRCASRRDRRDGRGRRRRRPPPARTGALERPAARGREARSDAKLECAPEAAPRKISKGGRQASGPPGGHAH